MQNRNTRPSNICLHQGKQQSQYKAYYSMEFVDSVLMSVLDDDLKLSVQPIVVGSGFYLMPVPRSVLNAVWTPLVSEFMSQKLE